MVGQGGYPSRIWLIVSQFFDVVTQRQVDRSPSSVAVAVREIVTCNAVENLTLQLYLMGICPALIKLANEHLLAVAWNLGQDLDGLITNTNDVKCDVSLPLKFIFKEKCAKQDTASVQIAMTLFLHSPLHRQLCTALV